jgi:Flp pilus assembly protein TadG
MGRIRDYLRSSKGQNIVEFALLTPIVILLMVAIIDFGAAMNRRIVLQHAAREGARMAAVSDNYTGANGVCDYTFKQAQGAIALERDITFTYTDLDSPANGLNAGDNVKITLPSEWDLPILDSALFGLFRSHIPPINLTASGSARLERTVPGTVARCP